MMWMLPRRCVSICGVRACSFACRWAALPLFSFICNLLGVAHSIPFVGLLARQLRLLLH